MTNTETGRISNAEREARRQSRRQLVRIFFGRGFIVKICFVIFVVFLLTSLLARFIAPYDPNAQDLLHTVQRASPQHLFGTDHLGRDVLSRIIYGGQVSLSASFLAGTLAAAVGIVMGLVSGYFGGLANRLIMGATDVLLCIPSLVLTLVLSTVLGGGLVSLVIAIGVGMIPTYVRMMNGLVISLRENDYITASRLIGQKEGKILFRHLLPNGFPSLIVLYTINLGNGIMTEASLSFLGVGINPPTATWGGMVSESYAYLTRMPELAIIPGVCIILIIIAFNVLGDALRDALDPRLRGKL